MKLSFAAILSLAVASSVSATSGASHGHSNGEQSVRNYQTFTGALAGFPAPEINVGGRGFKCGDRSDFITVEQAWDSSCDQQHNLCANAVNAGRAAARGLSVGHCDRQNNECKKAYQGNASTTVSATTSTPASSTTAVSASQVAHRHKSADAQKRWDQLQASKRHARK